MDRGIAGIAMFVLTGCPSRVALSALEVALVLLPIAASGHSLPMMDPSVNPPSQQADSENAKLTFLTTRAVQASVPASRIAAAQSIYYRKYVWHQTLLTVCFWNGSEEEQREVMKAAASWTDAAPVLTFDFEVGGHVRTCQMADLGNLSRMSNIRISLDADDPRQLWNAEDTPAKAGDWAHPGPSVSENPKYPVTMNLANVVDSRKSAMTTDYLFTVRHEFGHALGLVHEHQRQECKGWFNIPQIAHDTGWTESMAESQVDALPDTSNAYRVIGGYDMNSIMQYNFSPAWYMPDRPGVLNPCRRQNSVFDLSDMDKVVVDTLYQPELNNTPGRVALIDHARTAAAAAALPPLPGQKNEIDQALTAFQQRVGKPEPISIQVFPHPEDRDVVLAAMRNLGYPVLDQLGRPVRTVGHPTRGLEDFPTNAVLFTSDVSSEDVRYVALSLQKAGVQLRSVEPYYPSVNNGHARRTHLIQIGSDVQNQNRKALSPDDILTKPLPIYGEPVH